MNHRGTFVALVSLMAGEFLVGCSSNNKVIQPAPIAQAQPPVVITHPVIAALPPGSKVSADASSNGSVSQKETTITGKSGGVEKRNTTIWKNAGSGSIVKNQTTATDNSGKVQKRTTTTWKNAAGKPELTVTSTNH